MADGSRKRLRPWLEAMLNNNKIQGLRWEDADHTMFRIPWKHGGKHDWAPQDAAIFVEWAKHTGKYREGVDEPDYATFKTRLRCAFNKAQDIHEVREKTRLEDPSPFRVYRLTPKKELLLQKLKYKEEPEFSNDIDDFEDPSGASVAPRAQVLPSMLDDAIDSTEQKVSQMSIEGECNTMRFPSDLEGMPSGDLLQQTVQIPFKEALNSQDEDRMDTGGSDLTKYLADLGPVLSPASEVPDASQLFTNTEIPVPTMFQMQASSFLGANVTVAQPDPSYANPSSVQSQGYAEVVGALASPGAFTPDAASVVGSPAPSQGFDAQLGSPQHQETQAQQQAYVDQTPMQDSQMQVEVTYSGMEVMKPMGELSRCRLCYMAMDDEGRLVDAAKSDLMTAETSQALYGDRERQPIFLPQCPSLDPVKVQELTSNILRSFTRGILLDCEDGDIYATRFCKCTVYYCSPDGACHKLKRPESSGDGGDNIVRQKIFDYKNQFLPAWQAAKEHRGSKPKDRAYLFLGQQGSPSDLGQVLICVQVISKKAFRQMAASPLQSSQIQMSDSSEYDRIAKYVEDETAKQNSPLTL